MDRQAVVEAVKKTECSLVLKRKIVGVKFLFTEEEFENADAKKLNVKMAYCVMVKTAMSGRAVKGSLENFGCMGSARALGVIDADEYFLSGRHYNKLGLYQNLTISKNIRNNMTFCSHKAYGVMIKPLEDYDTEPDVVLVVTNPYNGMRILQGYTHIYGYKSDFKMSGNQAICSECTAYPFESNSINVSLLCSGTRFMGGWDDDEMAIGFPFNHLTPLAEGIFRTVNAVEPDKKKTVIEKKLVSQNREDLQIEYGRNYYTGLYVK